MSFPVDVYDVTLIGGGPVGMFGMFYAGIRDRNDHVPFS